METKIYNENGKEAGSIALPEAIFGLPWNGDLVHQTVTALLSNKRDSIAHTKTRGEVSGGGKKPWKQKGTGRARHGSTRSPIWVGGGVAHGPRNEKNYSRKINKKTKAKALFTILSKKFKDGEVLFVQNFGMTEPKTVVALKSLTALSTIRGFGGLTAKKNNAAYIAVSEPTTAIVKSFSNINNITLDAVRNIDPVSILNHKYVVFVNPEASVAFLNHKSEGRKKVSVVTTAPKVVKVSAPKKVTAPKVKKQINKLAK